jgi:hypothetical protein
VIVALLKSNINSSNAEQLPVNQPKDRHGQGSIKLGRMKKLKKNGNKG